MGRSAISVETADVLAVDPDTFQERVNEDAARIKDHLAEGTFNNPQGIIGLEYEFYAVSDSGSTARNEYSAGSNGDDGALMRVPRNLLSLIGFEKELGLHNAEMNTSPQPMNAFGLEAQESEVRARLFAALERLRPEGLRLVSDALFTIPPPGESARTYLTDSILDDGVRIATNMSDSARYHAMANTAAPAGMRVDAPHVSLEADTVMPESLITSIQPHYQVPYAHDLPSYFGYAIRIAGPLLALGVSSPFFPPDLYDDVNPQVILEDAWREHRISVFETSLNTDDVTKVRFPHDLSSVEEAVDRIAADKTFVPMPVTQGDRFDDSFAHFRLKHGTYWRWVRPVIAGASKASAHVRIEFRPISGQPTVRDSIAFQAVFAGLLERMHADEHPVLGLDWHDARNNFYSAMRDGLGSELSWVTAEGVPTSRSDVIFDDLLSTAAAGLRARGFSDEQVDRYLAPLRFRVQHDLTPARWKLRRVNELLNRGVSFEEAVYGMQQKYIALQVDTLFDGCFSEWVE